MSQRSGSMQLASSQQTLFVQNPDAHAAGLFGSHACPPDPRVGVTVGVAVAVGNAVQSPSEPDTLHDSPDAQDADVQQTRSSVLHT